MYSGVLKLSIFVKWPSSYNHLCPAVKWTPVYRIVSGWRDSANKELPGFNGFHLNFCFFRWKAMTFSGKSKSHYRWLTFEKKRDVSFLTRQSSGRKGSIWEMIFSSLKLKQLNNFTKEGKKNQWVFWNPLILGGKCLIHDFMEMLIIILFNHRKRITFLTSVWAFNVSTL